MPTYQYACTECGHAFEQVQSFSEDSLTMCPECGGRLRKVWGAVGVVFKGSGFYRNDSRAPDKSESSATTEKAPKTDKAPEKSTEKSTEKKSDSAGDKKSTKKAESTSAA